MRNEESPFSETGIWNIATSYSQEILMGHVRSICQYETIAEMGAISLEGEFMTSYEERQMIRFRGLEWMYKELEMLFSNSKFAIKNQERKKQTETMHLKLKKLKMYFDIIGNKKINQKTHSCSIEINEKMFDILFAMLKEIKENFLPILYMENLIFKYVHDYTPREAKDIFKERMIERG